VKRANTRRPARRRGIAAELKELTRLGESERDETGEVSRVEEDSGVTTDLPRIAEDSGVTTEVPRVAGADPARSEPRVRPPRASGRGVERVADVLLLAAAATLAISLFLPWSHQFSASLLARYGSSPMLAGVARNPDAWQVYSIVDVLLALLAAALVLGALAGGRTARLVLSGFVLVALAFTVHALNVAPTNGANIVNTSVSPATYLPNSPRPGSGEDVAVVALGLAVAGLALSVRSTA
jgi:hypothetical protein